VEVRAVRWARNRSDVKMRLERRRGEKREEEGGGEVVLRLRVGEREERTVEC